MDRMSKKTMVLAGAAVVAVGAAAWMYQSKWRKENEWLCRRSDSLKTPEDKTIDAASQAIKSVRASAAGPMAHGRLSQVPRSGGLAFLARGEPVPLDTPYGCNNFMRSCDAGDVGGCESMRQSCQSADNSVRLTMSRPGECDAFRSACEAGDYGSCDMYSRACQYEGN